MGKIRILLNCICMGIMTLFVSCNKEPNELLKDVLPEEEKTVVFMEYQKEDSVSYTLIDENEVNRFLEQISRLSAKPAKEWTNESVTLPIYGIAVAQKADDEALEPHITYGYWSNGYWIMPDGQTYKVKLPAKEIKEDYRWESENSFSSITDAGKVGPLVLNEKGWRKELLTEAQPATTVPGLVTTAVKYGNTLTVTIENQGEQAYMVEKYEYVLEVCPDEGWYEIPLSVWSRFSREDGLSILPGQEATMRYSLRIYDSLPDGAYRLVTGSGEKRESLVEFVLEQSVVPTPIAGPEIPRNLNGLQIIIGDTYSPEVTSVPTNAQEEAIRLYREEIMQTHNCTIGAKKVADWDKMQEVYISSVEAGKPVAQVIELDYRFIAKPLAKGLFYDLATLEEVGISNDDRERWDKWSDAVTKVMTKGKSIYGMRSEWMEPGGGIIFNKRLFEEAGLDPDLLYDLQARGEWTWSKFEEICEILTRDTDGDGKTDVYATCSDAADTLQCLVTSTGKDFIAVDKDGMIYNNCKDESVLGAMEFAAGLYAKGYEMTKPSDAAADRHISVFREGKAAMQFTEEALCKPDAPYGKNNMTDEIGFVVPPKPDGQEEYYTYVYGNVWVIPACYDAETAADIAFAYNLYTNETPGYNDEPASYQEPYYAHFKDERACDETLPHYNDKRKETVNFLTRYLVDGLDICDLTKHYPFVEKTPEECVEEVWDSWQKLIDESNGVGISENGVSEVK